MSNTAEKAEQQAGNGMEEHGIKHGRSQGLIDAAYKFAKAAHGDQHYWDKDDNTLRARAVRRVLED